MSRIDRADRCECAEFTGLDGCPAAGTWRVQVGSRNADAQLSCGRHLNRTCQALAAAELPRRATLTLTPVQEEQ